MLIVDGGQLRLGALFTRRLRLVDRVVGDGEIDHLLDDAAVFLGRVVDLEDLFEDDAVLGERLVDLALALFDALGDVDFALTVEKLDRSHLAQIHADGVVGLVDDAAGGGDDVGLDFFALVDFFFFDRAVDGGDGLGRGGGDGLLVRVLDDVDAEVVEADVDLVELFGQARYFFGQDFVNLVVKEKALFFSQCDELLDLDVFFFDAQLADPLFKMWIPVRDSQSAGVSSWSFLAPHGLSLAPDAAARDLDSRVGWGCRKAGQSIVSRTLS